MDFYHRRGVPEEIKYNINLVEETWFGIKTMFLDKVTNVSKQIQICMIKWHALV